MKKTFNFIFVTLLTLTMTNITHAGLTNRSAAISKFNELQNSYQKCMFGFNESRDIEYGAPELKCNNPYNQSIIRFIKEVRAASKKNQTVWHTINLNHIKFTEKCDEQTLVESYNPSFFIRQSLMCESSAYTSLAQVAIDLSY